MVEFGKSLDPDEEYDVLLNILDFPIECVEGDEVAADWDISNAQFLGPIPSSVLMGPPMAPNEEFNAPNLFPQPAAPAHIGAAPEHVETSSLYIPRQRKFAKVQSPVSVLESNGSCSRGKSLSAKSEHAIPARSRLKRVRYSGTNPWLLAAHELSTSKRTSKARKSKQSRKRLFQQPVSIDLMRNTPKNIDNSVTISDPVHQVASKPHDALVKKCAHCQSTKTPQWREGPLGPKTLCNACGVRYRSGRLFPEYRPAASPTFVPSQHSNSHRKVVEMRNEAKQVKVKTKIGRAPVQKQLTKHIERMQLTKHVDTSSSLQIAPAPKRKLLAKYDDSYSSHIPLQNKLAKVQESCAFSTQSRVSLLQSSNYLSYRSKYTELAGVNPRLPPSPCKKASNSMRDPVRLQNASNSMRGKESRKKKLYQLSIAVDVMKSSHKSEDTSLGVSVPARLQNVVKKCAHCQSTKTPQWREGPLGALTLCNACGLRYRSGRLLPEYRPAASPTFVPSQNSNSHREVMQMRVQAMQTRDDTKVALISPQPDLFSLNNFVHEDEE